MSMYNIIIYVMLFFFVLGAIDLTLENRFGLGDEFEKGLMSSGSLLILISGYICLAPVIVEILKPILTPIFLSIGADPSLFAGILFPSDAGGVALAAELAIDKDAGMFNGYIIGSIIGPTITVTIPFSIASVSTQENKRIFVIYGLLAGIVMSPLGMLVGGFIAGFSINMILSNTWPVVIFALCLLIALMLFMDYVVFLFLVIGKISIAIAYLGLTLATIEKLSGIKVISGMASIDTVFPIVGGIALFLAGAFTMLAVIARCIPKIILLLSCSLGIKTTSVLGLFITTANSIATFSLLKEMDDKGVMLNVAFAVAAAWSLGDHMAFTAQTMPSMLIPVIISKLVAGGASLFLILFLDNRVLNKSR